jgi:uncharacterized protein
MGVNGEPPGKRWHTREDSGIRLDRDGRWWHDDEPIEHPRLVEAFNTGLVPTDDGRFKLVFGWDWCFVEVEDAAYRVLAVDEGDSGLSLRLSDRTADPLEPSTLVVEPDGVLACKVKNGRAKARFTRDAQFQLGSHLVERGGSIVLVVAGREYPLVAG